MFGKGNAENEAKAGTTVEPEKKKTRKVKSQINNSVIKITVVMGEGIEPSHLEFDTAKLGQAMKDVLTNYGASTRLVGSAGGKKSQEAVDAINAAWQELVDGSWSPRKPAEKFSKKDLEEKLAQLPEEEQKSKREMLKELGIEV